MCLLHPWLTIGDILNAGASGHRFRYSVSGTADQPWFVLGPYVPSDNSLCIEWNLAVLPPRSGVAVTNEPRPWVSSTPLILLRLYL